MLEKIYHFSGSTYNFELVNDAIVGLMNIIHAGEMEAEQTKKLENPYITHFDSVSIGKMGVLLANIKGSPKQEIDAWRTGNEFTVEDQVRTLLLKIKEVAAARSNQYLGAKAILMEIEKILSMHYDLSIYEKKSQASLFMEQVCIVTWIHTMMTST